MVCASVDLEIDDLDVQNYVSGVVDCEVCYAKFLELVSFEGGVIEG